MFDQHASMNLATDEVLAVNMRERYPPSGGCGVVVPFGCHSVPFEDRVYCDTSAITRTICSCTRPLVASTLPARD
jgi:hypothetical protein